jgi:hypothetical protein
VLRIPKISVLRVGRCQAVAVAATACLVAGAGSAWANGTNYNNHTVLGIVAVAPHASLQGQFAIGPLPPPDPDTGSFAIGPLPPPDPDTGSFAIGPLPPPDPDTGSFAIGPLPPPDPDTGSFAIGPLPPPDPDTGSFA